MQKINHVRDNVCRSNTIPRLPARRPRGPRPGRAPHHICCCPSGSMPVDGSSSSTTDGSPRMLSAKHSWKGRNSASGTDLRAAQRKPEPRPYLSLDSLGQGLHGPLLLVLQLERLHQPEGNRGSINITPAHWGTRAVERGNQKTAVQN